MVHQSSQRRRASLWAKRYFGVKALTLHFKGQQTYMSTSFVITDKQSLVATLLYYKQSLHPIHIKSTLRW